MSQETSNEMSILLTCAICLEMFTESERKPMVLPCCGKTLCLQCINRLRSGTNKCPMLRSHAKSCPMCRQKFSLRSVILSRTICQIITELQARHPMPASVAQLPQHRVAQQPRRSQNVNEERKHERNDYEWDPDVEADDMLAFQLAVIAENDAAQLAVDHRVAIDDVIAAHLSQPYS